ncbi:PspA/IM30 family protein [Paenibacillus cremeus]|uniref:PspA/IM30 family protein n=1 Tax=Paenibacillus cremeus TaxID=2163881 RepID=A0A559KGL2_9BACL|nr:PspA/IM30 family protein [Paenibacillus cremeus]TVY11266.1 hypothetical protein FPZ49_03255 [Paenibacillus cremeus]
MKILQRLMDLSKAVVNEALDKVEKPSMMLNHYVRSLDEEIQDMEAALLQEASRGKTLQQQIAYYTKRAEQQERRAGEAMADDRMVEARQAVEAKLDDLEKVSQLKAAYDTTQHESEELMERLAQAREQYAALKLKQDELLSRAQKVEQAQELQASPSQVKAYTRRESASALRGFERMEEVILQKEAKLQSVQAAAAAAAAARNSLVEEQLAKLRSANSNA